jgi:hypothetical protein
VQTLKPRLILSEPVKLTLKHGGPEIKNPASSAGHSHFFFQWLRAKLDKIYPVLLVGASL